MNKPKCKYGAYCYRKNKKHLQDFDHSDLKKTSDDSEEDVPDDCDAATGNLDKVGDDEGGKVLKRKSTDSDESTSQQNVKKKTRREDTVQKNTLDSFFGVKKKESPPKNEQKHVVGESSKVESSETEGEGNINGPQNSPRKESLKFCSGTTDIDLIPLEQVKEKLTELCHMEMPEDMFEFWNFCAMKKPENPACALHAVGLHLIGPYDIFSGKHKNIDSAANFNLNYRYYYDPPEFMTAVAGGEDQFHLGYFRDDPKELPVFVASSTCDSCLIRPRGENIFAAVKWYLENEHPNKKDKSVTYLLDELCQFAKQKKISLDSQTAKMKARQKKVVCKTFHQAGLVVPVDKNDVGYRPVPETPADLRRMLKKIVESESEDERNRHLEPLEEIIAYVQFANDECDYGEGIELGLDLFSYGSDVLHPFVASLLCTGYKLLKRNVYADIVRAFLPVRNRDGPYVLTR